MVDASNQIVQTCAGTPGKASSLIVTGRGGLPSSPIAPLSGDDSLADWATLDTATAAIAPARPVAATIVEAQEWIVGRDGVVKLTAASPAGAAPSPTVVCHGSQNP